MSDDGYIIERDFAAPRELVWQMWTAPEHFSYWWGGTAVDVPLDTITLDARVGGQWRATMIGPDDAWRVNWVGEYIEVDEPSRLVFNFTDMAENPERDVFILDLTETADGTHMRLQQSGGHMPADAYEQARQGTASFLDAMAERLAALQD